MGKFTAASPTAISVDLHSSGRRTSLSRWMSNNGGYYRSCYWAANVGYSRLDLKTSPWLWGQLLEWLQSRPFTLMRPLSAIAKLLGKHQLFSSSPGWLWPCSDRWCFCRPKTGQDSGDNVGKWIWEPRPVRNRQQTCTISLAHHSLACMYEVLQRMYIFFVPRILVQKLLYAIRCHYLLNIMLYNANWIHSWIID